MKSKIKIAFLSLLTLILSSGTNHVLVRDLELLDKGWDAHFKNHNNQNDHLDFGKFRDGETSDTLLVQFFFPENFETKELKRGQIFKIGTYSLGLIKSDDYEIPVNSLNKSDFQKYEGFLMMGIEKKKN